MLKTALAVGILATAVAAAVAMPGAPARTPSLFSIRGSVDGLYPGVETSFPVQIRNPYRRRIRVVSVRASVQPSGRPCPVGNVRVERFRGSLVVAGRSTRSLSLHVRMLRSAPVACQGAVFQLLFSGRAVRP